MDLAQELADLVAALEARGVSYALCGALALAVHGVPRATRDLDILALPDDLDAVEDAARACGFTLAALPMRFASTDVSIRRLSKIVAGRPVTLDVLLVNASLRPVWDTREDRTWRHGRIVVVSRDGLISLKLTAGRPQDFADIERLEALADDDT